MRQYAAEWANPNRLSRDGITKETLTAGDRLIVMGSPGRNASENRIHLKADRAAGGRMELARRTTVARHPVRAGPSSRSGMTQRIAASPRHHEISEDEIS